MKIALDISPNEIIRQYSLPALASNVWVYMEIRKGIPGPKQAGRIENDQLHLHLSKFGYAPVARIPSLWKHATKNIIFSLIVDDFGVNYVGEDNVNNLTQELKIFTLSPLKGRHFILQPIHCMGLTLRYVQYIDAKIPH